MKKIKNIELSKRQRRQGILCHEKLREAEPLEREIARMKELKMPIQGGARPMYADEEDDVVAEEGDYRVGKLDIGRREISSIMAELKTQTQDIEVSGTEEEAKE